MSAYIVAVRSAGARPEWPDPTESFGFSLAVFEFRADGRGLATRSTRRSAHFHGLLPPILSAHGYDLAHLLWYCYRDLFLLSGLLLSGCTHRCCDRDNRYRGQSDDHFAYHGARSSVRTRTPAFEYETQQLRCGCPRAAVPRGAQGHTAGGQGAIFATPRDCGLGIEIALKSATTPSLGRSSPT